jgi:hypothetical protein
MDELTYNQYSFWFSIVSAAFSLGAIALSIYTNYSAGKQFTNLNQSYLHFFPMVHYVIPGQVGMVQTLPESTLVGGLTFTCDLTNVGNLPAKLECKKFDIFVNDTLTSSLNNTVTSVVYPKQTTTVNSASLQLSSPAELRTVNSNRYKVHVVIVYNDLGNSYLKRVDRIYSAELTSMGSVYNYVEILDSI